SSQGPELYHVAVAGGGALHRLLARPGHYRVGSQRPGLCGARGGGERGDALAQGLRAGLLPAHGAWPAGQARLVESHLARWVALRGAILVQATAGASSTITWGASGFSRLTTSLMPGLSLA